MFREKRSTGSCSSGTDLSKDAAFQNSLNVGCVRTAPSNSSNHLSSSGSQRGLMLPNRKVSFLEEQANFDLEGMVEPRHAVPPSYTVGRRSKEEMGDDTEDILDERTLISNASKSKFQRLLSELECEHNYEVHELKDEIQRLSRVDETPLGRNASEIENHSVTGSITSSMMDRSRSSNTDILILKDAWAEVPKYTFFAQETLGMMDSQLSMDHRNMTGLDSSLVQHSDSEFHTGRTAKSAVSRSSYDSRISKVSRSYDGTSRIESSRSLALSLLKRENGCILNPVRPFRVFWDMVGLLLISWDCVTIPIALSFDPEQGDVLIAISWFCTIFWSVDMMLSLFTGYFVKGDLIMDWYKIIKNYFTGWFFLDLITVTPDWILKLSTGGENNAAGMGRIMRIGRIARVLRLLRILKLKKIINLIYDLIDTEHMFIWVSLCKMVVAIFCLNHVVACGWFLVGKISKEQGLARNWLDDVGVDKTRVDSAFGWRYLTSLHWAITQFTPASMDIFATNVPERVYSVAVLFWSLVVLSSLIGNVSSAMTSLRNMSNEDHKHFWLLRRYLKQEGVSKDLQVRIVKYLEHQAAVTHNLINKNRVSLLAQMPTVLSHELANEQYKKVFELHPFFSHLQEEIPKIMYRVCASAVKIMFHANLEKVYEFGEECFSVYFLKSGKYEYNVVSNVKIVRAKAWSSETVLWSSWRHRGNLTAVKPGSALAVDPTKFGEILRIHPRPWHFASKYGSQILRYLNALPHYSLTDLTYNFDTWKAAVSTSDPQSAQYLEGSSESGKKKESFMASFAASDLDSEAP